MDKSFTFSRVRNYDLVKEQLDIVEHYEDNLNTNITNQKLITAFIENATSAHAALKEKYPDIKDDMGGKLDGISNLNSSIIFSINSLGFLFSLNLFLFLIK